MQMPPGWRKQSGEPQRVTTTFCTAHSEPALAPASSSMVAFTTGELALPPRVDTCLSTIREMSIANAASQVAPRRLCQEPALLGVRARRRRKQVLPATDYSRWPEAGSTASAAKWLALHGDKA